MLFDGRCASAVAVAVALGLRVGDALMVGVAVAVEVGVAVEVRVAVGVAIGNGVGMTLATITLMAGSPSVLPDASKPLTESVCAPFGTEVESHRIADGGDDAR
jgi:hypothetical protein